MMRSALHYTPGQIAVRAMKRRYWLREGKLDWHMIALSIPHYRTRMAVADFLRRWSDFFEVVKDVRWDRRFAKRHRFLFDRMRCNCGWEPMSKDYHYEDELYEHRQQARDIEWDRRWS